MVTRATAIRDAVPITAAVIVVDGVCEWPTGRCTRWRWTDGHVWWESRAVVFCQWLRSVANLVSGEWRWVRHAVLECDQYGQAKTHWREQPGIIPAGSPASKLPTEWLGQRDWGDVGIRGSKWALQPGCTNIWPGLPWENQKLVKRGASHLW